VFASKLKASAEALTRKDKEMNKFASFAVDVSNATSLLLINRKQVVTLSLLAHIGCWRYRYFEGYRLINLFQLHNQDILFRKLKRAYIR